MLLFNHTKTTLTPRISNIFPASLFILFLLPGIPNHLHSQGHTHPPRVNSAVTSGLGDQVFYNLTVLWVFLYLSTYHSGIICLHLYFSTKLLSVSKIRTPFLEWNAQIKAVPSILNTSWLQELTITQEMASRAVWSAYWSHERMWETTLGALVWADEDPEGWHKDLISTAKADLLEVSKQRTDKMWCVF